MTVITLRDALSHVPEGGALAGLVCLGWEEVKAYIEAGETSGLPVVLMVGPGARASMPLEIWGAMLRAAAEASSSKFVIHLDHGKSIEEVKAALDAGFSSVMYDGSALPLEDNIRHTVEMVRLATSYAVSTEAELGKVGYVNGEHSNGTDIEEAKRFVGECAVDFLAVSVGNTHLQREANAVVDWETLGVLAKLDVPLVIHGGSGIAPQDRLRMANAFHVRKFNIGTELRQVFGGALREKIMSERDNFDHLNIMSAVHQPLVQKAIEIINELGKPK